MNELKFDFKDSMVLDLDLMAVAKKLTEKIEKLTDIEEKHYEVHESVINLPYDLEYVENIKKLINEKKKLNPSYIVVIGIGGSNLGTIAVQEAIYGRLYNELNPNTKILYADTVDSDLINNIIEIIEPVLKNGGNIILNGISKSGSTTETIANFEILVELLKKYKKDYREYIIVTSDEGSKFWNLAQKERFDTLPIPKKVVGRYSILSAVGLFPLGLIEIDITELLKGAKEIIKKCLNTEVKDNPAVISASLKYIHYKRGKNIHNLFIFSPDLESLGKWYKQLIGESIGKEYNLKKERVNVGITPTISIGSTDLHSMAQLYLGGPADKFTTFVKIKKNKNIVKVSENGEYSELVKEISGKRLQTIMRAIYKGVIKAYRARKRPFTEIHMLDKSEYSIGQFLQFMMIETMLLGYLLGINPFNQPNVEEYKIETRRILENEL